MSIDCRRARHEAELRNVEAVRPRPAKRGEERGEGPSARLALAERGTVLASCVGIEEGTRIEPVNRPGDIWSDPGAAEVQLESWNGG